MKFRWLPFAAGVLVLVALLLWSAAAPVIAFVLETQLRRAGYAEPSVTGVSLALSGVTIDRLQLVPADAFVLDDIRVTVGANGIRSITVARLHLEAEVSADGMLVLPGFESTEEGGPPLDLLPDQGVALAEAEIRLATPVGAASLSLSDVTVQRTPDGAKLFAGYAIEQAAARVDGAATVEMGSDGAIQARLGVAGGQIEARGLRTADLTGEAVARLPARGSPALEVDLETTATTLAGLALGRLAVKADWHEGVSEFAVTSPEPEAVDVSLDGRAAFIGDALSIDLSGRILLNETEGQLAFEADLARALGNPMGNGAGNGALISGQVRVTGRGLSVPNRFEQGSLDFAAGIEGDTDRLRLTAMNEWRAALTPDAVLVPEAMRGLNGKEVSVTIAPRADEPLTLHLALTEKSAKLAADVAAAAGDGRLQTAADFTIGWAGNVSVAAEALELAAEHLPWGEVVLGVDGFEGVASYSADAWRLDGAGALQADGPLAAASFEGLTMSWSGAITGTSESIVATADDCIGWDIAALEWGERRLEDISPPCIQPGNEDVLLTYEIEAGGTRFAVSTADGPLEARLVSAGEESAIGGTWPALRITGATGAEGIEDLSAEASGGALILPTENVTIEGVDGAVELRGKKIVSSMLNVAAIESRSTPALWAPVSLEARAKAEGKGLSFEALISDALGIFVLEASGEYEDGQATSALTLYPIQFISGATQVGDLSPRLADFVAEASGMIGFEGDIAWSPDGVEGTGSLDLRDFGATVSGTAIAGVNASTSFSTLLPPATLPDQRLEIGQLDIGVPLENGVVVYDLDARGELAVQQLEFDLAGGRVYAEPFTLDSGEMRDIRFVLRAEEVELSQVLVLSQIEGLQGTGVLSGRVPVRMSDQGLQLDEGVLAAETDGVLRYTPEDLPAFLQGDDVRSRMLREALTNFQYEELSVSVASESGEGGEQRLTLSAKGANPDFLEGHPIELNFNFRGPLLGAMRSAVDLSGAGEIEDMYEEQEQENVETTQ